METTKRRHKHKNRYMTGEDIDMFRERERDHRSCHEESICDKNIDGA